MSRHRISLQKAKRLQRWALKESGAKQFLDKIPKLPNTKKKKDGLYVSYDIDENELDYGLDWPAPAVVNIYAIIGSSEPQFIGEIRAYNWETYWLSTFGCEEVDTAENWWELINEEYQKLINESQVKK